MNLISLFPMVIKISLVVASLCSFTIANAANVYLTADYRPNISEPGNTQFRNTTTNSGPCARWPSLCEAGQFSIEVPGLWFEKRMTSGTSTYRNSLLAKLDARSRNIILSHDSGKTVKALFKLTSLAMTRRPLEGTGANPWLRGANGGCSSSMAMGGAKWSAQIWHYPNDSTTICFLSFTNITLDAEYRMDEIGFGYELSVDSPIGLESGTYRGEVIYAVGAGGDIDFWGHTYSDTEIRFVVTATVQHDFNLQFPAGSNQVNLEPTGGWGQWLNYGRTPARLERNVQFRLTSSNPVNISLQCQHSVGNQCGLRKRDTGDLVGLETQVSLPGLKAADGSYAQEVLLTTDAAGQTFSPAQYVYQRNSQVHFRVNKPEVEAMLKKPGSRWAGQVTLMFDAGL
ncbi:hypothetical protein [Amphritea sp.]|uniref:hypothetical protein n=1 Tax=Amphritea sp. TaxID=1872502 RepID=UPI003A94A280